MLLVYSENITNRLLYITNFIFNELGINFKLITNINEFNEYNGQKLNYTSKSYENSLQIIPHPLLFENSIKKQKIIIEKNNYPYFFQTKGDFPFDIFAASFYLISRYEEYLPHEKDFHGRFLAKNSLAYKNNFLQIPVVDIWINELKNILIKKFPEIKFNRKQYIFSPTVDIDIAYLSPFSKGFLRGILSILKNIFYLKFKELSVQLNIIFKNTGDRFDTYLQLENIHNQYKLTPVYFVSTGKYGKYDKNIPVNNKYFNKLMNTIGNNEIGIHPSYKSNNNIKILKNEINSLSLKCNKIITKSRQHFLILQLPETYRNLIKAGITEDYTMGYAEEIGFRAGTCSPFYFYDLPEDKETKLKIFPFAIMDATLIEYKNSDKEDIIELIKKITKEVKKVNGTFITIWHNTTLSGLYAWKNWKDFYKELVKICINK
ncbi:MAG: polysaccharide deacetylase family protein [Bacteroidales bacterium]|nr:polysaccharide deacetylase family protein [Bacteroidales bacterium]